MNRQLLKLSIVLWWNVHLYVYFQPFITLDYLFIYTWIYKIISIYLKKKNKWFTAVKYYIYILSCKTFYWNCIYFDILNFALQINSNDQRKCHCGAIKLVNDKSLSALLFSTFYLCYCVVPRNLSNENTWWVYSSSL